MSLMPPLAIGPRVEWRNYTTLCLYCCRSQDIGASDAAETTIIDRTEGRTHNGKRFQLWTWNVACFQEEVSMHPALYRSMRPPGAARALSAFGDQLSAIST
jgi:hypothetical protein